MSTTSSAIGTPKAPIVPNWENLFSQIFRSSMGWRYENTYRKPPVMGPQSIPHVNDADPQAICEPKCSGLDVSAIMLSPKTPTTAPDRPWHTRATSSTQTLFADINRAVARAMAMKPETSGACRVRYLSQKYPTTALTRSLVQGEWIGLRFTHESQVKEQRHKSLIKQTTIFELGAVSQAGVPKLWKHRLKLPSFEAMLPWSINKKGRIGTI